MLVCTLTSVVVSSPQHDLERSCCCCTEVIFVFGGLAAVVLEMSLERSGLSRRSNSWWIALLVASTPWCSVRDQIIKKRKASHYISLLHEKTTLYLLDPRIIFSSVQSCCHGITTCTEMATARQSKTHFKC
eukprot:231078-Amphidinium_carterae.1